MTDVIKLPEKDEKMSSEAYEDLLDHYQFSTTEITQGTVVKGRIMKLTPTHVLVDIGLKTEGVIPMEDFREPEIAELKPGVEVEATLERTDQKDGYFILSKKRADAIRALDNLEKALEHNGWVTGIIKERSRGGYTVDVGIEAFLPESHADIKSIRDSDTLVGKSFKFKVMKFDRKSENAVVSRRLFLQDEREKKRHRVFSHIVQGQKIKGHVRTLTNFGAFVDIGGVEGLLHVSDMSWGKVAHSAELFQVGQEVDVVVLDFNEKEGKISLGTKQLTPDPWVDLDQRYTAGQKITGKVVSLTDFGAFVEIEKGVEGLVHISDLSWSRKLIHPKKVLTPGQGLDELLDLLDDGTGRVHDLKVLPDQGPVNRGGDAVAADDDRPALDVPDGRRGADAAGPEVGDDTRVVDEVPQRRDRSGHRAPRASGDVQGSLDSVTESAALGNDDFHSQAKLK